jgi:hypothetical protein
MMPSRSREWCCRAAEPGQSTRSQLKLRGIRNRWSSAGTSGHGRRVRIAGHMPSPATTSDGEAASDRVRTPRARFTRAEAGPALIALEVPDRGGETQPARP